MKHHLKWLRNVRMTHSCIRDSIRGYSIHDSKKRKFFSGLYLIRFNFWPPPLPFFNTNFILKKISFHTDVLLNFKTKNIGYRVTKFYELKLKKNRWYDKCKLHIPLKKYTVNGQSTCI